MKKIKFGYANESNPVGAWEGIGIEEGVLLTEAEYYGAVNYKDKSYIVAKVTEDKYGNYPNLVGKFIVRPALVDLYPDGDSIIFLDQQQSSGGDSLESFLNHRLMKDKIQSIEDVLHCEGVTQASKAFVIATLEESFSATSINHLDFEQKKDAIENCRGSFSQLYNRLHNNSRR